MDMVETAKRLLTDNMGLRPEESLLVVYDETTLRIGEALFEAGRQIGAKAMALRIPLLAKNGEEPFSVVAHAMAKSDVVVAPTGASLTHTQAKKNACKAGARVAGADEKNNRLSRHGKDSGTPIRRLRFENIP